MVKYVVCVVVCLLFNFFFFFPDFKTFLSFMFWNYQCGKGTIEINGMIDCGHFVYWAKFEVIFVFSVPLSPVVSCFFYSLITNG